MKVFAVAALVCLPVSVWGQNARVATFTFDVHGRRVEGFSETVSGKNRVESITNLNGRTAVAERVEEKVLREDASGKVTERVISGASGMLRKIRVEELRNPDGSVTVLRTTHRGDLNGRLELLERATTVERVAGDVAQAETLVERPGGNGTLAVAEKTSSTTRKTAAGSEQTVVTHRRDPNGRFIEAVRQTTDRRETPGETTESTTTYTLGTSGMELAGQTVSRTRPGVEGAVTREVDIYAAQLPGRAEAPGARLPALIERQLFESRAGTGNTVVETQSVSRPLADPGRFGPYQKIAERVCSGDCR